MPPAHHQALRSVALIEALKGMIVLIAGFGLLSFLNRDNELFAEQIIRQLHLNPEHYYPQIFINAMARLEDSHLWALAGVAAIYATVRFVEAYGLWHERRWAEWLAALSGGIYLPFEIYELFRNPSGLLLGAFSLNLIVVGYMVWLLTESRRKRAAEIKQAGADHR
ncbi:MAG: DUF2127 domain-containing protein [Opitutae bacterium]|jgi:uncharacterized membrane protein (DUF2068 family)|nr:DUF2127 domain-containing protein [Opitutae bacterium]